MKPTANSRRRKAVAIAMTTAIRCSLVTRFKRCESGFGLVMVYFGALLQAQKSTIREFDPECSGECEEYRIDHWMIDVDEYGMKSELRLLTRTELNTASCRAEFHYLSDRG
jgi:hypothetical protein